MIKIKCFGIAREIVDSDQIALNLDQLTAGSLRTLIQKKYPEFSSINSYMIAINQEYATDDQSINPNDEVAIIPPVSGG